MDDSAFDAISSHPNILPTPEQYLAAIQHPPHCFRDTELQVSTPKCDAREQPLAYSGGFTTTFHLINLFVKTEWAVRCFTRQQSGLEQRYAALARCLPTGPRSPFVPAVYLPEGVRVSPAGPWHPLVRMPWVQGETLDLYIEDHWKNGEALAGLSRAFQRLMRRLEEQGIAHGDLQHGNIIVQDSRLTLIDYDSLYVRGVEDLPPSSIMGLKDYAHPARSPDDYGPHMDRFTAILIYLAIEGIRHRPQLWRTYSQGNNLLFTWEDLVEPHRSPLLSELQRIPKLIQLVDAFRDLCLGPASNAPSLACFLQRGYRPEPASRLVSPAPMPADVVLDGTNLGELYRHVGQQVTVVGRVAGVRPWQTSAGASCGFVNLGRPFPDQTLTLVLWAGAMGRLAAADLKLADFRDMHVRVHGLLATYDGRPQIVIETPGQIRPLDEGEAQRLLSRSSLQRAPAESPRPPIVHDRDEDSFVVPTAPTVPVSQSTAPSNQPVAPSAPATTAPTTPCPSVTGPPAIQTASPALPPASAPTAMPNPILTSPVAVGEPSVQSVVGSLPTQANPPVAIFSPLPAESPAKPTSRSLAGWLTAGLVAAGLFGCLLIWPALSGSTDKPSSLSSSSNAAVTAVAVSRSPATVPIVRVIEPTSTQPPIPAATVVAQARPESGASAVVTIANLNVRSGPGVDFPVLTVCHGGDRLPVIARSQPPGWLLVTHDGQTGWASGKYLALSEPLDDLPVRSH